ncbi:Calcineurin-binding protein cabin-1 [Chelonia mydas]|uniref:Calcineurin-binding protein cabin-1 n=1 Tax=Chelonia mydas TaxID=8469 RepID=M7B4U8_CHEMY|nr:Calcineurin-binding protein cabin-1 [Chelonia mydas]
MDPAGQQIYKKPDTWSWHVSYQCTTIRKYLRDADRQVLAQRAFVLTVKVLEDTLNELTEVRKHLCNCPENFSVPPPHTSHKDIEPHQRQSAETAPSMSYIAHEEEELEGPLEGLGFQQQESRLCQQMKMATVAPSAEAARWQVESVTSTSSGHICTQASGSKPEVSSNSQSLGSQQNKADSTRVKTRILPTMPKLFIPSSITKFPPEITVTPPTPTLLSPKGSISEETKQKLKSAILSAQSAANVKKESLCQPALEILETSSQESSLESDTDEDDDYMDI